MFTALRTENVKADTSTITLDKHGGTGGTDTVDASLPDITPPTREGYTFNGYSYRKPGVNLASNYRSIWPGLTAESIKDSSVPDGTAQKITKTGDDYKNFRLHYGGPSHIKKGDEFTVSVWMKASKKVDMSGTPFSCELFSSIKKVKYPDLTTEWQQYVITGTARKNFGDGTGWEAVRFYFDNNQFSKGDSLYISSLKVEYGDTATAYSTPDASEALTKVYDANGKSTGQTVPDGATLYADWTPHKYSVKLDANGGTGTMADMTMTYDVYRVPNKCTFTNGEYSFKGWNTKADGSGTNYPLVAFPNMSFFNLASNEGDTATLYAQWGLPNKKDAEEGYYHLLGYYNEVLAADASSVHNEAQKDTKSQIWHITKYGDGYRLTDENDGKCLTAEESSSDTGKVSMQDKSDSDYQKWYFLGLSDGIAVMNAKNNYVLTFGGGDGTIDEQRSKNVWTYQTYNTKLYQCYHLQKATAAVTCEDWFVDKDNNRKVKIASHTKTYDYGATANGSDFGTSNINSKGDNITNNQGYNYKSSTSATVTESGATVYRYYWGWTDLNIWEAAMKDQSDGTVSLSLDSTTWKTTDNEIAPVQPYGTTYYIKDIKPKRPYEEFDHVSSNLTYDSTNKWYTYTPTSAGTRMEVFMKYKDGKAGRFIVDASGGTDGGTTDVIKYESTDKITVIPKRTGYTLTGLYTASSDGTKVVNADGSPANDGTYSKDGKWLLGTDETVHAQWKKNSGTVSYNANGGHLTSNCSNNGFTLKDSGVVCINGKEENIVNLHLPTEIRNVSGIFYDDNIDVLDYDNPDYLDIEKRGYHACSWNTKADGSGINYSEDGTYTAQSLIPSLAASSGGSLMLYVNWVPATYTVKFDANGGTGTMDSESMTYDASKALTASAFTKSDSVFTGWNTKADGSGTFYSDASEVKNLTWVNGGTVTLYAQWAPSLPHTGSRKGMILTLSSLAGLILLLLIKLKHRF